MRSLTLLIFLSAACSGSQDAAEDAEWQAYLAELKKPDEPINPAREVRASFQFWFEGPDASYDAWYGESTGDFPHRPTWRAHRLLKREMEARGWIVRTVEVTNVAPPSDQALDYLSGATANGDWPVRALALYILGDLPQLGRRPELRPRITSVLTARLMDGHQTVRASATWSLGRLLRETPERPADVITAIASRLKDSDPFVRYAAAHSLASLNSAPPEALPILKENLAHKSWWVVAGAVTSLMKVGSGASVAVPDLLALLHHSNGTVRRNSYAALEVIRPEALKGSPDAENVRKEIEALMPSIKSIPPEK